MKIVIARHFVTGIALVLLLVGSAFPVLAQDTAPPAAEGALFAAFPEGTYEGVYFEEFIEPGSSHDFNMALLNAGTAPIDLVVYPADVYNLINGGMGVNFQQQERTAPTTWLKFPEGKVTVGAGEHMLQTFTISVPEGVEPGQYVTAIAVETAESYSIGDDGGAFRQKLRKIVAVSILVPGDAEPAFELGEPQLIITQGQTALQVPVENTGNVRVRPAGNVRVTDPDGNEVASGDVVMGSVYMGHGTHFEVWLPNALPVGEYLVSAELADPETGVSDSIENVPVTVVPEATPEPIVATPVVGPVATPAPAEPVTLQSVNISANADDIKFANVAFDIENTGNHISRARVTLEVSHNGEVIEQFVIDDNLPLPVGTTAVEDRYIPPAGWESGTWTFSVTVHSINANENVETVVVSAVDIATIEVP